MRKILILSILFCLSNFYSVSQNKVGNWKFDDATNFTKADIGKQLTLVGTGLQKADGPDASNGAVTVQKGTYFVVDHGIPVKSGSTKVNDYSLVVDFKIPKVGVWYNFFQTDPTNTSDGECFINTSGNFGTYVTGYSSYAVSADKWYRLVVSVSLNNTYKYYLDGNLIHVGNIQYVDARFSLDKTLLLFADDDGDDGTLDVAEVSLYDGALDDAAVTALGGYGHTPKYTYDIPVVKPYLQTPGSDYMYVSWQDTSIVKTQVEYGITSSSLSNSVSGSYETINSYPYIWHTVKLTNLQANTKYFYRVVSGSGNSPVYSFRTQPDKSYSDGHVRFLLFGDTQQNPKLTTTIVNSAVTQMKNLFGEDYPDSLNFVLHTGDILQQGNSISSYTTEFLHPMEPLSCRLPFAIAPGNHEIDSPLFYSYMKFDEISPYSTPGGIFERFWSFKVARTLFVGLNSNIVYTFGDQEKTWFDELLQNAEDDQQIDKVFCFIHHCPYSELWKEGESQYSKDILHIMQKYSKAQQLSFGHTHDYEKGTVPSLSANTTGDISFVCGGGGGGDREHFSSSAVDLPSVNMSYIENFFIYADIDVKNKSHIFKVYGVGDLAKNPTPNIHVIDSWYRKLNQAKPEKPSCVSTILKNDSIFLLSSPYNGVDSLMSVELQATSISGDYTAPILDITKDWRNIYGVDGKNNPIDLNKGINLMKNAFSATPLTKGNVYGWRIRYRDHNLKWSDWSEEHIFKTDSMTDVKNIWINNQGMVKISNPIHDFIVIKIQDNQIIQNAIIYDINGRVVLQSMNSDTNISAATLKSGMYIAKTRIAGKDYYLNCLKE